MSLEQILAMAERVLSGNQLSPDEERRFVQAAEEVIRNHVRDVQEQFLVAAMRDGADLGEALHDAMEQGKEFVERNPTLASAQ